MTKSDLPGSARLWALIVLIAVFIIGAASGAAVWYAVSQPKMPPLPPIQPMMGPIPIHELNLTKEQHQQLDKIFEAHRPKLDAVLNETFPKVRAINKEIEKDLMGILTDEQKQTLEMIKARMPFGPPPFGMRGGMPPGIPEGGPHHGMQDGSYRGAPDAPPPGMPPRNPPPGGFGEPDHKAPGFFPGSPSLPPGPPGEGPGQRPNEESAHGGPPDDGAPPPLDVPPPDEKPISGSNDKPIPGSHDNSEK